MSLTRRPVGAMAMMTTSRPFAYSCCCPRGRGHDAAACRQVHAVGAVDRRCPLLVDIGEGAVTPGPSPGRTVDDLPGAALFSDPYSSPAHRKSADLAWRPRDLRQRSTGMESGGRERDRARAAGI